MPPSQRPADGLDGLRFWLLAVAVFLGIETVDRTAIAAWSLASGRSFDAATLWSLAYGLADDAATALTLGAPFLLGPSTSTSCTLPIC